MINQKQFEKKKVVKEMVKKWLKVYNFGRVREENEEEETAKFVDKEHDQTLDQSFKIDEEKSHQYLKKMSKASKASKKSKTSQQSKLKQLSFESKESETNEQERQRKIDKYLVKGFIEKIQFKDNKTRQLVVDTSRLKSLFAEQKINLEDQLMTVNFQQIQHAIEQSYTTDLQQSDQSSYILSAMDGKFLKLEHRLFSRLIRLLQDSDVIKKENQSNRAGKLNYNSLGESYKDLNRKGANNFAQMVFSDMEDEEMYQDDEDESFTNQFTQNSLYSMQQSYS